MVSHVKGTYDENRTNTKTFQRFLYFRDFQYYDYTIDYNELVSGYEVTTLAIRRDLALMLLLRDILRARLDSPYLLGTVHIYAPTRNCRPRGLFQKSSCRTVHCRTQPINRAMDLYNRLSLIDPEIDIFFGSRGKYSERVINALLQVYSR